MIRGKDNGVRINSCLSGGCVEHGSRRRAFWVVDDLLSEGY